MRESRMGRWMPSYGVEPARRRHIALGSCVSVRTIWLFAILFTLLQTTQADGDLAGDSNALLAFRDAVDLRKSLKWSSSVNACQWEGVTCAGNPLRISILRLPGSALSGPIPSGTLGNLTELIILSLRSNRFSGSLLADLANCVLLRGIYLQINNFSGPLPSDFSVWPHLQRVDFSFNHFSGNIPSSFNSLPRLRTLLLQNNSFTGSLPPLNISNVTNFSVANNELNGSIPVPLRRFSESDFLGNHLCGLPLTAECLPVGAPRPASVLTHKKSRKLGTGAIVGIVLGGAAFLSLLCIICIILCRGEKERDVAPRDLQVADRSVNETSENLPKQEFAAAGVQEPVRTKLVFFEGSKQTFELEELLKASAEVLGKGSVGTAYKAMLEDGTVVAVKRLKDVTIERSEFEEKIREIGILRHENLVPLRAYYFSRDEKLLVYDYMPRGSLSALLHGNKGAGRTPLDWETRIRIALGAARGIAYLHEEGKNDRCAHGNIKSSNILLSGNLDGCVSDYGLSQIIGSTSAANRIVGYRAPEVTDINKVTQKADVYSFGVLLLELLTGKAPTQASLNEEGIDDLPRWVQSVVREEWTAEVFDLELMRYQNIEEDMLQTLQVAMLCVSLSPDQRPSMKEVVKMIEDARKADGYGKKPSEADEGRWQGNGSEIDNRV